jgi:hypothetical protein
VPASAPAVPEKRIAAAPVRLEYAAMPSPLHLDLPAALNRQLGGLLRELRHQRLLVTAAPASLGTRAQSPGCSAPCLMTFGEVSAPPVSSRGIASSSTSSRPHPRRHRLRPCADLLAARQILGIPLVSKREIVCAGIGALKDQAPCFGRIPPSTLDPDGVCEMGHRRPEWPGISCRSCGKRATFGRRLSGGKPHTRPAKPGLINRFDSLNW